MVGDVYRVFASGVVFELPIASSLRTIRVSPVMHLWASISQQTATPGLCLINIALSNAHAAVVSWTLHGFSVAAFGLYTTRTGTTSPGFMSNGRYFVGGVTGFLSSSNNNPSILDLLVKLYPNMKSEWEGWSCGAEADLGARVDVFSNSEFIALSGYSGRGIRCINCPDTRVGNIEEVGFSNALQVTRGGTIVDATFGTYTIDTGNRVCNLSSKFLHFRL